MTPQTATLLTRPLVAPRYGALLTPVGLTGDSDALVRSSVGLANQVGAHLVGVSCVDTFPGGETTAVEEDAAGRVLEASRQRFLDLSAPVRAGRTWRRAHGPLEGALAEFGWAADLVLLRVGALRAGSPEGVPLRRLLHRTGSPVLALPEGHGAVKLHRVTVVCDGSDACRRTVRSAMPVIARSGEVTLLAADRSAEALRRGLATRGWGEPTVRVVRPATSAKAADQVADLAPDLAILGGWSEMFGGWPGRSFTQRLLRRGATPLLVAA